MQRRWIWFGCFALGILAIALSLGRQSENIVFPIDSESELRVLKVSLGTNHVYSFEPRWKQVARRLLPDRWESVLGPFKGQRYSSRYPALFVWLGEYNSRTDAPLPATSLSWARAAFTNGNFVSGRRVGSGPYQVCLEFPCFQRELRRVPLQVVSRNATMFNFTVENPSPARAQPWNVRPMPQTGRVDTTEVTLKSVTHRGATLEFSIGARSLNATPVGWTAWYGTAFDPFGNFVHSRVRSAYSRLQFSHVPPQANVWKIVAEGQEYISAGLVAPPTNASYVVLNPNRRGQAAGLKFLMLSGPGRYRIDSQFKPVALGDADDSIGRPKVTLTSVSKSGWRLETTVPGILLICDSRAPEINARIRERIAHDRGRIFGIFTNAVATERKTALSARFIVPRLPTVTTNLEVEIIAPVGPVEFFVKPPQSQVQ